jgi:peptidyl-prolyl cis-trans isomerase A (cyclophilin A)
MTSSANIRGLFRGLIFILVIASLMPSYTPLFAQTEPVVEPEPDVVPLSPPSSQTMLSEALKSAPVPTPGSPPNSIPPGSLPGYLPGSLPNSMPPPMPPETNPSQVYPLGTPTPELNAPQGYPAEVSPAEVLPPQPLAPGPGTSSMPAPISPGDFNVPAPDGYGSSGSPAQPNRTSVVVDVQPTSKAPDEKKRSLAIFRTSVGNFTVQLFTRQAPRTTANFIDLARGDKEFTDAKTGQKVRRPFYNGLIFHRVVKGFIVQSGCPLGNGRGGPGFTIADEFTPSLRHRRAGIVSMANAGTPDTNGSQFLITLGPQPAFDDKYTVFGEVIQGMSVIREIAHTNVGPTDRPIKRIYIIAVDIVQE